jgi:hypothetical protein
VVQIMSYTYAILNFGLRDMNIHATSVTNYYAGLDKNNQKLDIDTKHVDYYMNNGRNKTTGLLSLSICTQYNMHEEDNQRTFMNTKCKQEKADS